MTSPRDRGPKRGREDGRGGDRGGNRNPARSSAGGVPARRGLDRILSKLGVCSRLVGRELVRAGRVKVNGVVIVDPDGWFDPDRDEFRVDGRVVGNAEKRYVALNKPRGYLTTRTDPNERSTVYELLGEVGAWVVPVGRLDLDTSGLLLFTNDTQFADAITSPASHVPKTYKVECKPRLSDEALERLRLGVTLSDGPTRPAVVVKLGDRGPATVFTITITEGRNRQVRRMVKEVGAKVERLQRTSIGPLELGDLASGKVRALTAAEVSALLDAVDVARGATERKPGGARGDAEPSRRSPVDGAHHRDASTVRRRDATKRGDSAKRRRAP